MKIDIEPCSVYERLRNPVLQLHHQHSLLTLTERSDERAKMGSSVKTAPLVAELAHFAFHGSPIPLPVPFASGNYKFCRDEDTYSGEFVFTVRDYNGSSIAMRDRIIGGIPSFMKHAYQKLWFPIDKNGRGYILSQDDPRDILYTIGGKGMDYLICIGDRGAVKRKLSEESNFSTEISEFGNVASSFLNAAFQSAVKTKSIKAVPDVRLIVF